MWEVINTLILIVLVAAGVASFVGAFCLRIAASWVVLMDVPYLYAVVTVFIGFAANVLISIPIEIGAAMLATIHEEFILLNLVTLPLGFLVFTVVIYWRLAISFGYALLTTLAMLLISFIAAIVLGFLYVLIVVII